MSTPTIVVLTAGMSLHSSSALLADRLKDAAREALRQSGADPQVRTYHLSQYSHEIADHLSMGFPSGELAGLLQALREADAIITVSPTFKASYSGLFKSLWDLTEDGDIADTPVLLGATGGTPRHSLMIEHAMRPLFAYLHADIVNTAVFAATEDFGNASTLESRIRRAGAELAQKILWRRDDPGAAAAVDRADADTDLAARGHSAHPPGPPTLAVTPFDRLLNG